MSEDAGKQTKNRKINRMTPEQAKAVMAKCELAGETQSDYYLRVKEIAERLEKKP
jgi:hypothetical protein